MEDEDFVADSDEDEQEMLEALAMEEERLTRQRLEAGNHQQVERQEESREQNVTAVVTQSSRKQFKSRVASRSSLKASSRPPSGSENSVSRGAKSSREESIVTQRRRHRILDSSDEESSDDGDAGDNRSHSPDQPEHVKRNGARSNESLAGGGREQGSREKLSINIVDGKETA
ncbi:hypothetical protein GQ600_15024 [Phytophthora cactorum]|nr:hypothetical protein GQ600_15024 [Phytophthora cactorum]